MGALVHNGTYDDDASLVAQSVAGSRAAFARIVARYQQLVCSVAYSATGSVSRSEDLAQDTFVAAWRQLADLREPARLRAWLCGIARNAAHDALRSAHREPANDAEAIDAAIALEAAGASPPEEAVRAEEQAILWRSIERIPETYREPLVLFYREHQSIESVAASLELSEDAVKQRLSRGRRLLQDEVLAFVEGALERSGPGSAFTLAVMASIPAAGVSTPAAAAVVGSTAAKTGAAGLLLALAGPVVSTISMILSVRAGLDAAPTPRERALVVRQATWLIGASILFAVALHAFIAQGAYWADHATAFHVVGWTLTLVFGIGMTYAIPRCERYLRVVRAEERARGAPDRLEEYVSATRLLGLPLVHLRFGVPAVDAPPVRAWVAVGDRAYGVLFAMGNVAVGTVALGAVAAGGLAIGGVAVGVVPMAAVALGVLALGGSAIGLFAVGGLAFGWETAAGGAASAREFAAGGFALAPHANDAVARAAVADWLPGLTFPLMLVVLAVVTLVPLAWYARRMRRLKNNP